ncbi:NAD(P)-dependent oxidoreductase [Spongiibacter pelagi]|nr:NAD(P)-dependent oxidoreductase [Spongiibacter pelagi]
MIECGFIGLGNIGKPMAKNLARKAVQSKLSLRVYDVMPAPMAELEALGAKPVDSPEEIARHCELVGICVRHDQDVEDLLYGSGASAGIFELAPKGAVYAIHSTVNRDNMRRWGREAAERGLHVVDAPITGGEAKAEAGDLCIMLGADEVLSERLQPMLACMSTSVVAAGAVGDGTVLKLANNLMNYIAFVAASEGMGLVKNAGVNPEKLLEVVEANGVMGPLARQFVTGRDGMHAACSVEDMEAIFGPFANLAEKDLDHALALAGQLKLNLPCGKTARDGIRQTFLHPIVPANQ